VTAALDPSSVEGSWTRHLRSAAVMRTLASATVLKALHPVAETASTQDVALDLARDGSVSGTAVVADAQRRGRGRQGRRWDDVPGGGTLAMTLLLDLPVQAAGIVPHAVGLAVADAVIRVTGDSATRPTMLKWPNDVIVRDGAGRGGASDRPARKLAGILVQREAVIGRDVLLIGIGLNVDLRGVPPTTDRIGLTELLDVRPDDVGPAAIDREQVLVGLLAALDMRLGQLLLAPLTVLDDYRERSDTIGRHVDVDLPDGRRVSGTVATIDDDGRLVVDVAGRSESVLTGTVRDHVPDRTSQDEEGTR